MEPGRDDEKMHRATKAMKEIFGKEPRSMILLVEFGDDDENVILGMKGEFDDLFKLFGEALSDEDNKLEEVMKAGQLYVKGHRAIDNFDSSTTDEEKINYLLKMIEDSDPKLYAERMANGNGKRLLELSKKKLLENTDKYDAEIEKILHGDRKEPKVKMDTEDDSI